MSIRSHGRARAGRPMMHAVDWWAVPVMLALVIPASTAPAQGQDLFEAIGNAIDEAMESSDDGGYGNWNGYGYDSGNRYGDSWDSAPAASTVISVNRLPYRGPGVTIVLEEDVGGSVHYLIDGKELSTIQAGQEQTLTAKGSFEIRFSRGLLDDGRDLGEARYTVTEGNYHFVVSDKGWELYRDREQPNLVTTRGGATSTVVIQSQPVRPPHVIMQPQPFTQPQPFVQTQPFMQPQRPAPAVDNRLNMNTGQDRPTHRDRPQPRWKMPGKLPR